MTDDTALQQVGSRQVHYFHGFDPASVNRYRRISQASAERLSLTLEDLPGEQIGWRARRGEVVSDIHHARYADQVRRFQDCKMFRRLGRGIRALVGYLIDGSGLRIARQAPRTVVLALSPILFTFVPFLIAAALVEPTGVLDTAFLAAFGIALVVVAKAVFLLLVADLFAFYREIADGRSDVAENYLQAIADLSEGIPVDNIDERLIVGHSLGGIGAILATDRLLDRLPDEASLGLLTLGSNHGLVLLQRGTGRDRLAKAIARIARDRRVFWLDVSSPRDAFCVPLTDPLLFIQGDPEMRSPRVISAQLAKAPRIPGDRRTVFAAMRRHMGYLLPPSAPDAFDFVGTVTGDQTLAAQFADRNDSPKARMWHR
ncbi:MAG: hypothetical protein AAF479_18265 [Pseudomonadota bacterium]